MTTNADQEKYNAAIKDAVIDLITYGFFANINENNAKHYVSISYQSTNSAEIFIHKHDASGCSAFAYLHNYKENLSLENNLSMLEESVEDTKVMINKHMGYQTKEAPEMHN